MNDEKRGGPRTPAGGRPYKHGEPSDGHCLYLADSVWKALKKKAKKDKVAISNVANEILEQGLQSGSKGS